MPMLLNPSSSEERHVVAGVLRITFQWLTWITAILKRPVGLREAHSGLDNTAESRADHSAVVEDEAVITQNAQVTETTLGAIRDERGAIDAKIREAPVEVIAAPPNGLEIMRRRELVRKLFNDFWSEVDGKPPSFAERLDQAEGYLNERLAVSGELWRLSAKTRKMLGLPPRSKLSEAHNEDALKAQPLTAEET